MTSAFGVAHSSPISKGSALGSTESMLELAHAKGEHAGQSFRRCAKCHPDRGSYGSGAGTKADEK